MKNTAKEKKAPVTSGHTVQKTLLDEDLDHAHELTFPTKPVAPVMRIFFPE